MPSSPRTLLCGIFIVLALWTPAAQQATATRGDTAFTAVADEFVQEYLRRYPTYATLLGVHDYDDRLEDFSKRAVLEEIGSLRAFRGRVSAVDASTLSLDAQLDREQLLLAIDSLLLEQDVIRPWATRPDMYSSGITRTAFVMVKRSFASPDVRLKALIARERQMTQALQEARVNLENPPAIHTEIAIEQLDGNRAFFAEAVPAAFATITDERLLGEFKAANDAVIEALGSYKAFLETELRPRSNGRFAIGRDTLSRKFAADEMVHVPLDRLLAIARADLERNQEAFRAAAARIAPGRPAADVLAELSANHPPPERLLQVTQGMLDSLRQFIESRSILTIPQGEPARVEETPPFLRATTSASMDTPGPFETQSTEAYYNMTLPEPSWPLDRVESFMRQWYVPMIANVSIHEVYPGHYTQFLYGPRFPSRVRKVFGAATNSEGWAHYTEQMMLDEGYQNGDPAYRLAQLQDALLRDVRFIVGIKMHSEEMTIEEAQRLFEQDAYQPPPVALSEARRGTSDPTYGYYTLGKLMILKLRDDYRVRQGQAFSLREFHDRFLQLGPLPLPLVRRALLGEEGNSL